MASKSKDLDWSNIERQVNDLIPIKRICKDNKIGEQRLKRLLLERGIDISSRTFPPRNIPDPSLVGQRFNKLTITGYHQKEDSQWWMEIQCDCGNVGAELLRKLKNGQRKTCGKNGCPHFHNVRQANGRSGNFTGYKEIYGSRWKGWELGAVKRNIDFRITPEYAWDLYIQQNKKCALSGVNIEFGNSWNKLITASLDRKNSSLGYIEGNVQWVHKMINIMKRDMTDEEFIERCNQVVEYQTRRTTINPFGI